MKNRAILNNNCYRILNTTKLKLRKIGRLIKQITNYNLFLVEPKVGIKNLHIWGKKMLSISLID
jgi:hypothetical protein